MTDRFRPAIWLIDTASGRQMPLVAGTGAHSQPRWSPDGDRLAYVSTAEGGAGAALRALDGVAANRSAITGLPNAPDSIAWSPDGRQIAYTMFVPDEGAAARPGAAAPGRRDLGRAAADHHRRHLPLRRRRAICAPAIEQIFLVSADGGAPRQLSYGRLSTMTARSPGRRTGGRSISAATARKAGSASGLNSEVYALDVASNRIAATHQPQRAGQLARRLARRPHRSPMSASTIASAAMRTASST